MSAATLALDALHKASLTTTNVDVLCACECAITALEKEEEAVQVEPVGEWIDLSSSRRAAYYDKHGDGLPDDTPLFATPQQAAPELDRLRALLLWTLYHHQGASSQIGQPIRAALGIGQHHNLTPEQVRIACDAVIVKAVPKATP